MKRIGWILAWAVMFSDIGANVFYTPGILYRHVKYLTPYFILLTTFGFLLLAQKYGEVSWRNPEGGGVLPVGSILVGFAGSWLAFSGPHRREPPEPDPARPPGNVHAEPQAESPRGTPDP